MADERPLNVFVSLFSGLSTAASSSSTSKCAPHTTLCIPLTDSHPIDDLFAHLTARLPTLPSSTRLILTTPRGRQILPSSHQSTTPSTARPTARQLASLLSPNQPTCAFLSLNLSLPLCAGKGGFGSQLRAAGGRMSSRKKRAQNAALATGSARNLDGRRLRTVAEAKNLAAYLATKPEADAKEREEKRRRWEGVVEMAEQREREIREGKVGGRKRGLGDEWVQTKEEVGEGVRSAVQIAMAAQAEKDDSDEDGGSGSGGGGSGREQSVGEDDSDQDVDMADDDILELDEQAMEKLRVEAEAGDEDAMWVLKERLRIPEQYLPQPKTKKAPPRTRRFAGFDDEDDDEDSSDEDVAGDEDVIESEQSEGSKEKGKAKAT
ncbi:Telomere maintenance protein SDE2 [Cyphellophora attinorum]|uniref:Telomere maintenance protein SDE2 n=1 Tax=Cyphellophora attinorum TaxID=1664694 RepID=A0A0N1HUM5_9EURO|nr:Telomere maintenance protein SDE2 [Phialophora attinorum]KPI40703.1 Telomere maintenance protein SDE2 [Phialophora attinorum]